MSQDDIKLQNDKKPSHMMLCVRNGQNLSHYSLKVYSNLYAKISM